MYVRVLLSVFVTCLVSKFTATLILSSVEVPTLNVAGGDAVLVCDFKAEDEEIYSVKWYKGGREIYRYLPSRRKPLTIYPRPGVHIDKAGSNISTVTLSNLTLRSTGRYRCEVSSEAPKFTTKSDFGDLIVLVLPSSPPIIKGGKEDYSPGDTVQLNCSSFNSKPAADINWFINQEPANLSNVVRHPVIGSRKPGLYTSCSSLFLTLSEQHFDEKGKLTISCEATIRLADWTNHTLAFQNTQNPAD